MNLYFLMTQLPSLDAVNETTPLPITEEQFYRICQGNVGEKLWEALKGLSLIPPKQGEPTGYSFINLWNERERSLRLALASVRARKMKKSVGHEASIVSPDMLQVARTAVDMDDPLSAEIFLNRMRLDFLETMRPLDGFSKDMLLYYGLKLKLLLRIRKFDGNLGPIAYRNIYDAILREGEQEVER